MPNSFFEYFPQGHMQSSQAAYIYVASRPFPLATVLLVYWRRTSDIRDVDHSESTPMAPLAVKSITWYIKESPSEPVGLWQ